MFPRIELPNYTNYCKMEFFGLSLLVGVDIILGMLYRYWDSMKPKPLTFLEFFNFSYDQQQAAIEL